MSLEEAVAQQARIALATSGASPQRALVHSHPYCRWWLSTLLLDVPCQSPLPWLCSRQIAFHGVIRHVGRECDLALSRATVYLIEWHSPLMPMCVQITPGRAWAPGIKRGRVQKPPGCLEDSLKVLQALLM